MSVKVKFLNLSASPFYCSLEIRGSTLNNVSTIYDSGDSVIRVVNNGVIQNITSFDVSTNAQEIYIRDLKLESIDSGNYSTILTNFAFSPNGSSDNSEVYLKTMKDLNQDAYPNGGDLLFVFGNNIVNEDATINTHNYFAENVYFIRQDGNPGPIATQSNSSISYYPIIPVSSNKAMDYIKKNFPKDGGARIYFMIGIPISPGPGYDYSDITSGQQQMFLSSYSGAEGLPSDYNTTPSNPPPSNLLNYISFN